MLLILAGVAISTLTGENGIINRTISAKNSTDIARAKERVGLYAQEFGIDFRTQNLAQRSTATTLSCYIAEQLDEINDVLGYGVTVSGTSVTLSKDGQTAIGTILDNGNISWGTTIPDGGGDETVTTEYGLFDADGVKIASWDELVAAPYYLDIEKDVNGYYEDGHGGVNGNAMYYVLEDDKFANATTLKIPDNAGITKIGDGQFSGDELLSTVNLPEGLESIGKCAFQGCEPLTSLFIPNSVTSIGDYAFYGTGLTSLTIPSSVTNIGSGALGLCDGFTIIFNTCPSYTYDVFDNAEGNVIVNCDIPDWYFSSLVAYEVEIGSSCHSIGNSAFKNASLGSIVIPNSVTSIEESTFESATIGSIVIPNSITSIGDSAFFEAILESGIVIPNSVTSIGDNAFAGTDLESIDIPNSVTSIGSSAFFSYNSQIEGIVIPSSVTSIGDLAFGNPDDVYIDSSSITSELYQNTSYSYDKFGYNIQNIYIKSDCFNSNKNSIGYENPDEYIEFKCNGSADGNGYYKYERTVIEPEY